MMIGVRSGILFIEDELFNFLDFIQWNSRKEKAEIHNEDSAKYALRQCKKVLKCFRISGYNDSTRIIDVRGGTLFNTSRE